MCATCETEGGVRGRQMCEFGADFWGEGLGTAPGGTGGAAGLVCAFGERVGIWEGLGQLPVALSAPTFGARGWAQLRGARRGLQGSCAAAGRFWNLGSFGGQLLNFWRFGAELAGRGAGHTL